MNGDKQDPYAPSDPLTALELSESQHKSIPTEGRIKLGLSNDDLLALHGMPVKDVSEIAGISEKAAESLLLRVGSAITKNPDDPKPGMLNLPHFLVTSTNPAIQPEIDKLLGKCVHSMVVKLMQNFSLTASVQYRWYDASGLQCYSTSLPGVAMAWDKKGNRVQRECKRRECEDFVSGKCRRRGKLFLRIEDLKEIRIYNPFMMTLHSPNVCDRMLGQLEIYADLIRNLGVAMGVTLPLSAPLFELRKVEEDRHYPKQQQDGTIKQYARKQWVPSLYLKGAEIERMGPEALQRSREAIAALTGGEPQGDDDQIIDLGPDDAVTVTDAEEVTPEQADGIGPAVDVKDLHLTPDEEVAADTYVHPKDWKGKKSARTTEPPATPLINGTPTCCVCGDGLTEKVAAWCADHAEEYDGKFYCYKHQPKSGGNNG